MRRKIAAGNWKMNGTQSALSMITKLNETFAGSRCEIVICPPAPLLFPATALAKGGTVSIGVQDCHTALKGAHTGDCSAALVAESSAKFAIVGHSERRAAYGETDEIVAAKASAAQSANLTAIVCIGETLADRDADRALDVVAQQLAGSLPDDIDCTKLVIAYEPVWAIGTGKVPTPDQISEVHALIRSQLTARFGSQSEPVPVLYGGSVNAGNAQTILSLPDVDGALVGGASLTFEDFSPIVSALQTAP